MGKEIVVLRRGTMEDVEGILRLESECMEHPWGEELVRSLFEKENTNDLFSGAFVAVCGEKIVGYVGFSYVYGETEIGNICVENDYRRQGIGGKLLDTLIDLVKGEGNRIFLEVSQKNETAYNLYLKKGFKKYNVRPDYYGKNNNAILMSLDEFCL